MKRTVISNKNLPISLPLSTTLVAWLVLDKLQAAGWIWGAVGIVFLALWIASVHDIITRKDVELFKEVKP
jgi:hypothetical protein